MQEARPLIVGLGNPGAEYEQTRHNIGFVIADDLAARYDVSYKRDRANALLGWGQMGMDRFGIVKPLTYMNRSGSAVQQVMHYYDVAPEDLLVVYDDLNLPLGKLRVREGGSAGGHNGMRDLIQKLGTDAFPRLRVGVGNDFAKGRQAQFVLSPFAKDEQPLVEETRVRAIEAVEAFIREGITVAMNKFN